MSDVESVRSAMTTSTTFSTQCVRLSQMADRLGIQDPAIKESLAKLSAGVARAGTTWSGLSTSDVDFIEGELDEGQGKGRKQAKARKQAGVTPSGSDGNDEA